MYLKEDTKLIEEFVSFELEPRNYERPLTGNQNSIVKVIISTANKHEENARCFHKYFVNILGSFESS